MDENFVCVVRVLFRHYSHERSVLHRPCGSVHVSHGDHQCFTAVEILVAGTLKLMFGDRQFRVRLNHTAPTAFDRLSSNLLTYYVVGGVQRGSNMQARTKKDAMEGYGGRCTNCIEVFTG